MYIYKWIVRCEKHMEEAKKAGDDERFKKWYWASKRMKWKAFQHEKEKLEKSKK